MATQERWTAALQERDRRIAIAQQTAVYIEICRFPRCQQFLEGIRNANQSSVHIMSLEAFILAAMTSLAPARHHDDAAAAVAQVVFEERPLIADDDEKIKTAALLISVAFRESSLRNNAIGDKGRALCMFQLWHAPRAVLTDITLCTRIAISRIRDSIRACGLQNALGTYAVGPGGCRSAHAQRISRDRVALAKRLVKEVQP